jgi:ABC-2 type transport system ATP-binding protein
MFSSNRLLADPPAVAEASADFDLLALDAIQKRWGALRVLDDADLVIDPGTTVHIAGRNGIGKTTLLRIAAGLISPDSGMVSLDGLHPVRDRRRYCASIGFLSAGDRGLVARLTVRQTLKMWARMALMPAPEIPAAIERVSDRFALAELLDHRLDRSSLGQRQRVRLALAFLHNPRLLLLDEPANSLDEEGVARLDGAVDEVLADGGSVLWCSPGQDASRRAFTARYVLENGKVLAA